MSEALQEYQEFLFDDGRWARPVYRRGSGPAVIVIHEMPGLHPLVIRFADRIVAAGMTAVMPSLFGQPGKPASIGYAVRELFKGICIRREFAVWSTNRSSPIVDWLRALSREMHKQCGGQGVGAVGMCFTGNFALAMMTEPSVIAPVLSQPSLPISAGLSAARRRGAIGISDEEIACAKRRFAQEGLSVIGLRFRGDRSVPDERFATLKATFGESFEAIELDPKDARPGTGLPPHSVLTLHLKDDDPAGPTKRAEQRVLAFFQQRLGVAA